MMKQRPKAKIENSLLNRQWGCWGGLAQCAGAKVRNIGYGVPSDFELNFGRYLPALGRADDDDTHAQPG